MTLAHLLRDLSTTEELRRFLRDHLDSLERGTGETFVAELEVKDLAGYADDAAEKLRQRGYIEPALWRSLERWRPRRLADIQRVERACRPPTRAPGLLYVHLLKSGDRARWTWWSATGRIKSREAPFPTDPLERLLGPPEGWPDLLTAACGRPVHSPAAVSLRVQLHAPHPELRGRPFPGLRHGPDDLIEGGWTVEHVGPDRPADHVQLDIPAAIDIVTTGDASTLRLSLINVLEGAWPIWWDRRVFVRSAAEVRQKSAPIRVVVGAVPDLPPVSLELTVTDGPYAPARPSVAHAVYVGDQGNVAALEWLRAVLVDGRDPAAAWQRYGAIHTRYASFRVDLHRRRPKLEHARRRLDRFHARATADGHLRTTVADPNKRVLALFGSGTPDNLLESLFGQVEDWAERGSPYHLVPTEPIALPPGRPLTPNLLDEALRLSQGLQPGVQLSTWLTRQKARSDHAATVVVLDLGVATAAAPVNAADLRAVLEWARDRLRGEVPAGVRVVVWLTAAISGAQTSLVPAVAALRRDRALSTPGLDFYALDPLAPVEFDHIVDFLKEQENSSCPPDLVWDIATELMEATGGQFDLVVAIIEACERLGWFEAVELARARGWKVLTEPNG